MTDAPPSRYLELQVPEEQLLGFLAQEGALNDPALDALERQLEEEETDPGELAGVALTVGRAGRAASAGGAAPFEEGRDVGVDVVARWELDHDEGDDRQGPDGEQGQHRAPYYKIQHGVALLSGRASRREGESAAWA